jgi:cytochrome c oxidase subunit III
MANSTLSESQKQEIKVKTAKPLLYIAIGSMVMLFGGLVSAYIVSMSNSKWMEFDLPQAFWFSTGVIIASSVTFNWALSAAKSSNKNSIKLAIALTLVLGIVFVILQFIGWGNLRDQNVFFAGRESNGAGSYLYALTGLHMVHLFGGIISLLVVLFKSLREKYDAQNLLGLQLSAIFWHFLDILWVCLFIFLLLVR